MYNRVSGYDWIWRPTRFAIYHRDHWRCLRCCKKLRWRGDRHGPTLDHVVPVSRGGHNLWHNLVTMCNKCNSSKRDCLLHEMSNERTRPGFAERVAIAVSSPIDRNMGRILCAHFCPEWYARQKNRLRTTPSRKHRGTT